MGINIVELFYYLSKMYHKRKYIPVFPEKYIGDASNIIMRSSWETRFAIWCDKNPQIIKWSSEETIVPYVSPVDGKPHRYFVDFKIQTANNKTFLVEIKPSKQTIPPEGKRKTKRYLEESTTYLVNQAKWEYAKRFAKARNWEFIVITEHELGL
jgi:hypothetical protein